ncbi:MULTISPECIES: phosphoribosylformylglycinamidine synthase subunit PurS [Helicobacter]|uniref:Phosphoribosylformylglycinamidine synthase subunit PurS n=1 Tax=Helicobacter typhlonius TaxID=76936 RepID=A0A099UIB7_9HELI|nr:MULTISPECIES: phosphoribosylformylglycinamidine synthase subunit PurS [Helicobacter]TLD78474.1 phosphoribosylformylglycinamidine synthase, purS protein [Helicobacter typhlonius]TLD88777.1 phosphoribosylformylglycinamidine synthase, purS protein [Helicobacter sp. MIT 03-1616]CUU39720.1 Phosphoribosylformylglycinamidine synthase, PurS subunit [Helicobacter typhlonius]
MKVKVLVCLKEGVLDPQAKAIFHALSAHGFDSLQNVKLSKEIILDLQESDKDKAHSLVQDMCENLLANVVIEDYSIEILQ